MGEQSGICQISYHTCLSLESEEGGPIYSSWAEGVSYKPKQAKTCLSCDPGGSTGHLGGSTGGAVLPAYDRKPSGSSRDRGTLGRYLAGTRAVVPVGGSTGQMGGSTGRRSFNLILLLSSFFFFCVPLAGTPWGVFQSLTPDDAQGIHGE